MNNKLEEILASVEEDIKNMPYAELYKSMYGFTPEEEQAYTHEKFMKELTYLRTFFVDGQYCFEPKYAGEPEAEVSKLFWNFIENNARSKYEDASATFPTYYSELPNYGIRVSYIDGQGTITTVEDFDYTNIEYIAQNASRLKREGVWREQERIKEMLRGKPNYLDEVEFSTVIDGKEVSDSGVIIKVYTKKNVIRYLIDSVNYGNVIVFINNDKHPVDTVQVKVYYPDNYDTY